MAKKRVHLIISGRVQGVDYRYSTYHQAISIGAKGWVRNIPNNKVEIIFEGEEPELNKMIQWCYQGPPMARVDNIEITEQKFKNEFKDFSIKH